MKKRMTGMLLIIMLVVSSVSISYGQEKVGNEIMPSYVTAVSYIADLSIDKNGLATFTAALKPKPTAPIDSIKATVVITRKNNGEETHRQTYNLTYSNIRKRYDITKSCKLPAKGLYEMIVIFKCYDGSSLIETITSEKIMKSYT